MQLDRINPLQRTLQYITIWKIINLTQPNIFGRKFNINSNFSFLYPSI